MQNHGFLIQFNLQDCLVFQAQFLVLQTGGKNYSLICFRIRNKIEAIASLEAIAFCLDRTNLVFTQTQLCLKLTIE
jgi:hypothetical protein